MIKDDIRTAVAIGKFDGMHLGHKKLLDEIRSYKERGFYSLVFTFESPISDYFTGDRSRVLTTNSEKLKLMEDAGIDYVYMMPVNKDTISYEPYSFIKEMLVARLHAGVIAAGDDLSFGNGGAGNMELLMSCSRENGGELDYHAKGITKVMYEGEAISSSLIREAISKGRMERAQAMLGRPYSINGKVMHGRKLGRTIGMPTANQIPDEDKLIPPYGVYRSVAVIEGREYKGITNIGIKPTVKDDEAVTAETHILDFDRDIYGEDIEVRLCRFIRPEMKFDSLKRLKEQMMIDMRDNHECSHNP